MTTLLGDPAAKRTIVGYCWPWTVRPGEQVKFMVSCESETAYRADLVRIICGDNLSSPDMFKEQELRAAFNGSYEGRRQSTYLGSYVEVAPTGALDQLKTFTAQAMVCPTSLPRGLRTRLGGVRLTWDVPSFEDQHLVSRWDDQTKTGWALLIDAEGRPVFMASAGGRAHRVILDKALVQDQWFLLCGGIDAEKGRIYIAAKGAGSSPGDLVAWSAIAQDEAYPRERVPQTGPLRFGACADGPGKGATFKPARCFNGKLDRVRLIEGLVTIDEAHVFAGTEIQSTWRSRLIGFWDFSKNMDRVDVTDVSPNGLHGMTINLPTRAVRGVDWDGSVNDWRQRPEHYSAIHFHSDDLYDAQWDADFSYTVPTDLPSGIYAARLRHGASEDYIPFFVAPPLRQARNPVAVLIPTLTYTAYTNVTGLTTFKHRHEVKDDSGAAKVVEEDWHPCLLQNAADAAFLLEHATELGKGIYANHPDGTLYGCASQRHPNMTIKPKGMTWALVADTHLTDWLERKKIPYDIVTDDLLHQEGVELLKRYRVVITGTHPEYYTLRMLDAVEAYQKQGGRWMYLGGNGFYWVTSVHSQLPGAIEVRKDSNNYSGYWPRYQLRHAFDGTEGGLWRENGREPQRIVGVGLEPYVGHCFERGVPYKRLPDSHHPRAAFIFEGITQETIGNHGLFGGGAAGQEVDSISYERGTPAHALHLARADSFIPPASSMIDVQINQPVPIADMVFFETPNGGAVFSVGSMSWIGALSHNDYDNDISMITGNVLRRFMDERPISVELERPRTSSAAILP